MAQAELFFFEICDEADSLAWKPAPEACLLSFE